MKSSDSRHRAVRVAAGNVVVDTARASVRTRTSRDNTDHGRGHRVVSRNAGVAAVTEAVDLLARRRATTDTDTITAVKAARTDRVDSKTLAEITLPRPSHHRRRSTVATKDASLAAATARAAGQAESKETVNSRTAQNLHRQHHPASNTIISRVAL